MRHLVERGIWISQYLPWDERKPRRFLRNSQIAHPYEWRQY
jgi:hypothetical protein